MVSEIQNPKVDEKVRKSDFWTFRYLQRQWRCAAWPESRSTRVSQLYWGSGAGWNSRLQRKGENKGNYINREPPCSCHPVILSYTIYHFWSCLHHVTSNRHPTKTRARDVNVRRQRCHGHGELSHINLWTRHLRIYFNMFQHVSTMLTMGNSSVLELKIDQLLDVNCAKDTWDQLSNPAEHMTDVH